MDNLLRNKLQKDIEQMSRTAGDFMSVLAADHANCHEHGGFDTFIRDEYYDLVTDFMIPVFIEWLVKQTREISEDGRPE